MIEGILIIIALQFITIILITSKIFFNKKKRKQKRFSIAGGYQPKKNKLSKKEIRKCLNKAYRKTISKSPRDN